MSKAGWTRQHDESDAKIRALIPSHLNADELIANSWVNAAQSDIAEAVREGWAATLEESEIQAFEATALMYIDQNCSSF